MPPFLKKRPDGTLHSPYWQIYFPKTKQKEPTDILVGNTPTERKASRELADALYHKLSTDHSARIHQLPTAKPAIRFDKYAAWYKEHKIPHRKGEQRELELLAVLQDFFDDDLLTFIDQDRVSEYLTHRTKRDKVTARTANREVDLLKQMIKAAVPKYLATSPLAGMARLKIVKPRRRYTTKAEFAKLLAACEDAEDRGILILGRLGLARLKDLLDLKHTDREGVKMYVRDPKGDSPYHFILLKEAQAAVKALANNGSPYLFPKFRRPEKPRDWPNAVRQHLKKVICKQADVPYGRTKNGVTFHWGTRRSGATDLLIKNRKRMPAKVVQIQGNWKTTAVMDQIYTEVTDADMQRLLLGRAQPKERKRA